jgi:hypothetical protein
LQAVLAHPNNNYDSGLLDSIIATCIQASLFEKAGSLYEYQQHWTDAKAAYRKYALLCFAEQKVG